MSSQQNSPLTPSLFKLLRQKLDQRLPTVRCTKATLIHLSHTLEDIILSRRIPAIIFAGFQQAAYWREEAERYAALAQVAQQICIFASAPLLPESKTSSLHITLNGADLPYREWFLAILAEPLAIVLCGQDCEVDTPDEAARQFDTLWSFDPQPINAALNLLAEVVAVYQPEQLPQLQAMQRMYPLIKPDPAIITEFTLKMIGLEETVHQRYQKTEVALQQYQERLEEQVLERTTALTKANEQLQQEITERQQAEAALATEHNFLRTLIDNLPDLIYIKDTESRFVLVNAASLRDRPSVRMEEIIGKTDFDIQPVHLATQYYADEQAIIHSGQPLAAREELNIDPSGQQRWFLTTKVPLRDSQGQIVGLVGLSRDITERKQAENELKQYRDHLEDLVIERTAELRAANQQLQREVAERKRAEAERTRLLAAEHEQRLLAETMREVTLALTSQTDHTAVLNEILRQAQRMVQYSAANITLLHDAMLRVAFWQGYEAFNEEFVANLTQPLAEFPLERSIIQSQTPLVIHDTQREPNWVMLPETMWIKSHIAVPICLHERVLGLLRLDSDIPGQFSAEDAQRLQALANAAAIALENAQLHQQTQKQARQMEQILHSIQAGILLLDPDYRIKIANKSGQAYLPLLAGVEVGQVLTHLGERPLVELLVTLPPGQWHEVTPVGLTQPLFQVYIRPVMAESAETEGWIMVFRDITEERDIQKRMQQQEKLVAIGQLAAGIAHDFNNILTSMIGFAELARWTPDLPMSVGEDLNRIIKQGQRAAYLVRQILDFARKNITAKRPLELNRFLEEMVNLLERTIPENIRLDLQIEPNQKTYLLSADSTQLQQALTNLAVNAADAMPTGGILQFHLSPFTLEVGQYPPCPEMPPGDWLALSIADTGVGMPLEVQLHLFEPFFTTKEVGRGTGLGLAQVEGIIKQHEGYIKVKSQVEQGTTFTLYLPPLPPTPPTPLLEMAPKERKWQGQSKLILLVEDNEFVLEAVEAMLKGLGYQVLIAANGHSALKIYDQYRDSIALVITDLTMPEMGGLALAEALQAKNRAVKILAITGYPLKMSGEDLLAQGIVGWLQKPLSLEQLAQQLEQALQN